MIFCAWILNGALRTDACALAAAQRAIIVASLVVAAIAMVATYWWYGAIDPFGIRGVDGLHNARQKLKSFGPVLTSHEPKKAAINPTPDQPALTPRAAPRRKRMNSMMTTKSIAVRPRNPVSTQACKIQLWLWAGTYSAMLWRSLC